MLVLNPLLEWLTPRLYQTQTGRTLHFNEVRYNPFTLALHAGQLADHEGLWAIDRVLLNVSASTLWRRAVVLDEMTVAGLRVDIEQITPERWNFSDILEHQQARAEATSPREQAASEPSEWPLLEVNALQLGIARADVRAPYLAEPFAASVSQFGFAARAITTAGELAATARRSWATFAAHDVRLGIDRIALESLREEPVATEVRDIRLEVEHFAVAGTEGVPFALTLADESGGRLFWHGTFSLEQATSEGRVDIEGLSLRPVWEFLRPQLPFRIASGTADLGLDYRVQWADTPRWELRDGGVRLGDIALTSPSVADTRVALGQLEVAGVTADSEQRQLSIARLLLNAPAVTGWNRGEEISLLRLFDFPADEPAEATDESWQLVLQHAELRQGSVDWRATQLEQPLEVRELSVSADGITWPAQQQAGLELSLRLGGDTELRVAGNLHPGTLNGEFEGELKQLSLPQFNPLLAEFAYLRLDTGTLDTQWRLTLTEGAPGDIASSGALHQFDLRRTGSERETPLAVWEQLTWRGLTMALPEQRLAIEEIALRQPDIRFRINRDGTTNFGELMKAGDGKSAPAESAGPATEDTGQTPPWQIAIQRISSEQGVLRFADLSLPYPFRANIEAFTGAVTELSSDAGRRAQVDFRGNVGGYAPVIVTGEAAPLAPTPELDVKLSFDNVDMALLSPYSSTYAGYAIDRGLISVNLQYALEDERIRGSNRVLVRQLQLGERVESPRAVDLPIRLALALLTDANGVIDLNVDVTGDIGDPQFGLGDVIRRAFFNAIRKVVTSPFRLLAQLGGSRAEDLDSIPFAPGSAALESAAVEKLAAVKRGLEQRPKLLLSVAGHTDQDSDVQALRAQVLGRQLVEQGLSEASLVARDRDWERAVTRLYEERLAAGRADEEAEELSAGQQWQRLLDTIDINPGWLRGLASRRAQEVKQHLIDTGLPPDRVLIDASADRAAASADAPQASLSLEG